MSDLSSLVHSEIARLASASLPALDVAQPRSAEELAALIDHTLLAPSSTPADVERVCAEARQFGTATVCVNSSMIPTAVAALKDSSVRPIAVIGFPFGASNTKSKMVETEEAVRQGAKEIDMVQNIGLLRAGDYSSVHSDISAVVRAAGSIPVKVILETSMLSREELIASSICAREAGAAFIKTSTGYGGGGANVQDVRLMYEIAHVKGVKVKASGGIRTLQSVRDMVAAGASRVGASGTAKIVAEISGAPVEPAKEGAY